jgi:serine protease Do
MPIRLFLAALLLGGVGPLFSASPAAAADKTAAELAAELKPAVVVITMQGRDGGQQGIGTGFVVDAGGLIATNLHVIGEARPLRVQTAAGKDLPVTAIHAYDRALDLALLRVDARDLPALELADSSQVKAGQPVVAIGNPHGLKHSIVQGIVSGQREIERRPMLQVAIPVEPGNSGGPVVDLEGRVVGIMTMKAQLTENLGFAVESNALKPLLARPNTIPIDRWLKIGALDPAEWTPLFGANWTQRGGSIFVSGVGTEFGGRSLCLAAREPELPFELSVRVKFAEKSGAAGLVWHADGEDRHYGFYPSAGKLRLSRFDGPSVFQWQVLQEVASEHYREGEWNDLSVRVAKDKIVCAINGQVVIESTDAARTAGQVGLAKFRETSAEFRRFRVGPPIAEAPVDPEAVARLREALAKLPSLAELTPAQLAPLSAQADPAAAQLHAQAEELERRAIELRRIAADVRTGQVVARLSAVLAETGDDGRFDLLRAALLLAQLDDDELDVEAYAAQVARIAAEIEKGLAKEADAEARRAALHAYLFEQQGFHGSRTEYYHAANSHLHRVIDEREGLPITLAVLYMELGRRIGLTVEGVGLPGHFVVRVAAPQGEPQLIDVFDQGKALTRADAAQLVRDFADQELTDEHLQSYSQREILIRMLRNLVGVAQGKADREALLRYTTALLALEPDNARDRGMRAVVRFETGRREAAIADLDWFLAHEPPGINLNDIRNMQEYFRRAKPER